MAASISGKVVLELAVASGVVTAAAYSIGGAIAAAAFMGISAVTVSLAYIVAPLLIPMLWPFKIMTLKILEGVGFLLLGGFTSSSIGRGGLPGLISRFYEFLTSGTLYRNARILAVMVFVIGAMALIAKFTLTRRPKDFTKWVCIFSHACILLDFNVSIQNKAFFNCRTYGKLLSLGNPNHKLVSRLPFVILIYHYKSEPFKNSFFVSRDQLVFFLKILLELTM